MQILHWDIDSALKKDAEENYRTRFAAGLKNLEPLQIIRELTFDGVVPHITVDDIQKLFTFIEQHFLKNKISGVGLEVGAGPLTFSSVLAARNEVEKVYGVEICEPIVKLLAPKIASYILGDQTRKVVGVVGSFDEMELPDQSIDFVFDFFSLHHSLDIHVTLQELYRVLKPGGVVLCLDKARPDSYSKADLDALLDRVYPPSYNIQFGIPVDQKIDRRSNGEREYRKRDWELAFRSARFSSFSHNNLSPIRGGFMSRFVKNLISFIPPRLQTLITWGMPKQKASHAFVVSTENRVFSRCVNSFRKEISLLIAYK